MSSLFLKSYYVFAVRSYGPYIPPLGSHLVSVLQVAIYGIPPVVMLVSF